MIMVILREQGSCVYDDDLLPLGHLEIRLLIKRDLEEHLTYSLVS